MAFWAVARTLVRRETFAAGRLEAGGFEAFAPLTVSGPLFPGYLFIHIADHWRAIDRTVGVLSLVKFGESPARCPDAEIAALQGQVDVHTGLIRLPDPPKPAKRKAIPIGDKVKIPSGPFRGFTGIYAGQTPRERERILIDLLGRKIPVELPVGQHPESVRLASTQHSR
jgi:transcriptional antiterminator RfaH